MESNQIAEKVLAYLRMEMNAQARKEFEAELLTNPELKTEFELMRHIKAAVYLRNKSEQTQTKQWVAEAWEKASKKNKRKRQIKWAIMGLSFFAMITFFVLKYNKPSQEKPPIILKEVAAIDSFKQDTPINTVQKPEKAQKKEKKQTINAPILQDTTYITLQKDLNLQKREIIALAREGEERKQILATKVAEIEKCPTNNAGAVPFTDRSFAYPVWVNQKTNENKQTLKTQQDELFILRDNFKQFITLLNSDIAECEKFLAEHCR